MSDQRGFTLVELLAAMVASLLLLGTLSWAVSSLARGARVDDRETQLTRFSNASVTLSSLIRSAMIPAANENLPRDPQGMAILIPPPAALGNSGPLRLDLSVRGGADGEALVARVRPTVPWVRLPPDALEQIELVRGYRSISFDYLEEDGRSLPALVTITFQHADGREQRIAARPLVTISSDCVFDPISLACRPI